MPGFYFDTEFFLLNPGCGAPPLVCLQFAVDDQEPQIIHVRDPALPGVMRWALETPGVILYGHNVAADTVVLSAQYPELFPLVWDAYARDKVTCTRLRERLADIARGLEVDHRKYGLVDCLARRLPDRPALDKTDPWRMKYGELLDVPVAQWPAEALSYARGDATAQRALVLAEDAQENPIVFRDQFRQARAGLWLRLAECWGVNTDPVHTAAYHAQVLADLERDRDVAITAGLVRHDGTKDTKAAMRRMVEIMAALGEEPTLTDTGEEKRIALGKSEQRDVKPLEIWVSSGESKYIKTDEDACLEADDPALLAYQRFGSLRTTLTRVDRLYRGFVTPIQPWFDVLKNTGRTSCIQGEVEDGESPSNWGFQMHNLPREEEDAEGHKRPGLRECFIAPPCHAFCSVDYDGIELRTWAQVCIWALQFSRMAEVLNSGEDPHTDLGASLAHISYAEAKALLAVKGPAAKDWSGKYRQSGKIANFGFPGGMGAAKLRKSARAQYRVRMTLEEARALRASWRMNWPEAQPYFDWVNRLVEAGGGAATVEHFISQRIRGHIPYTVTCNGFFQGLAADAFKAAGFELARECYGYGPLGKRTPLYGTRIWNEIHDEFLTVIPIQSAQQLNDAAYRQAEIVCKVAQQWIPDVKITATPALMRRWSKKADAKYNSAGLLVPWED